jgi:hypothetical protein
MNINLELLEKDLNYGKLKEDEINLILKHKWQCSDIVKTSVFHPFDFYIDCACPNFDSNGKVWNHFSSCYIEVKSRRNEYSKYPTTMVGYNKIEYARKFPDKFFVFIFVFTDGIYCYWFNPNDKFETTMGGRVDRGKVESKLYYYIPIEKLEKII